MKTISYLKKAPFIIAIALAFTGCSEQSPSSLDIAGEWKINADESALEVIKATF